MSTRRSAWRCSFEHGFTPKQTAARLGLELADVRAAV